MKMDGITGLTVQVLTTSSRFRMSERCQAEYVMSKKTLNDAAVPTPAALAKVTVVIASSITGNTKNSLGVYSQRMLRRPLIGLLSTSLKSGTRKWVRNRCGGRARIRTWDIQLRRLAPYPD